MKKNILISSAINQTRACITEDGDLAEYFIEFPEKEKIVNNIYLGRVTNIVQGINAAFIDIGLDSDAFLHFSDVDESLESSIILDEDDDDEEPIVVDTKKPENPNKKSKPTKNIPKIQNTNDSDIKLRVSKVDGDNSSLAKFSTKKSGDIQINLKPGQDIVVQVTREAYSTKGVKVTSKIAIPGRYLVLLPFDKLLGVSKKIKLFQERKRLRYVVKEFNQREYGCIIRTAANGKSKEELERDWSYLKSVWEEMEYKIKKHNSPCLIYKDASLTKTLIRDMLDVRVENIIVDSNPVFNEVKSYLNWISPQMLSKLKLYKGGNSVFEEFEVEKDIANIYRRTVRLKSGGSIVIDQTEAMTVIDVNSGRSTDNEQELTAVNTNLEAMVEVCKQIRLRDMGGMVVIDFIDMLNENNKKKLFNEVRRIMSRDRAKSVIFPLTQLGLMQITRQRINQNISEKVNEVCPVCNGIGTISTSSMAINDLEKWIKKFKYNSNEFKLLIRVHPSLAEELLQGTISKLNKLMFKYFLRIKLLRDDSLNLNQFKVISVKSQKDITKEYFNA